MDVAMTEIEKTEAYIRGPDKFHLSLMPERNDHMSNNIYRLHGTWTIPATNETYSGELLIDKDKSIIALQLTDWHTEDSPMGRMKLMGQTAIIKGVLDSGASVLLLGCEFGGISTQVAARTDVTAWAEFAFWGLDIDTCDDMDFLKARVDFGEIIAWADIGNYEWEDHWDDESNGAQKEVSLEWVEHDPYVFQIDDNTKVTFQAVRRGSCEKPLYKTTINVLQGVDVTIEYANGANWSQIVSDIVKVENLIAFGMSAPVQVRELNYVHRKNKHPVHIFDYQEHRVFLGNELSQPTNSASRFEFLLSLSNLFDAGANSIANWYTRYDLLQPVIELYESPYRYRSISDEMLFLNLTQALETFHARFISNNVKEYVEKLQNFFEEHSIPESWQDFLLQDNQKKRNSILLKNKLAYLFCPAVHQLWFDTIVCNLLDFIQKIVDTRNYLTHYDITKKKPDLPPLNSHTQMGCFML